MAIAVTAGIHNRRCPISLRTGSKRRTDGINGIDSHFNRTVGAIFEADRTRKP
ncbi:hypothetical protein ACLK17_03505 [Escherichia coli]